MNRSEVGNLAEDREQYSQNPLQPEYNHSTTIPIDEMYQDDGHPQVQEQNVNLKEYFGSQLMEDPGRMICHHSNNLQEESEGRLIQHYD